MNHNFRLIEKHYDFKKYVRTDISLKESDPNDMNEIEKYIKQNDIYIVMIDYVSVQEDVMSYYLLCFDSSTIIDIIKINILQSQNGYRFHSITCRSGSRVREQKFEFMINNIIEQDNFIDDEYCYFEIHEDIAYILDPRRGNLDAYVDIIKKSH